MKFFLELLQSLEFVKVGEKTETKMITEEMKEQINIERDKINIDADYLLDWDHARKSLRLD